MKPSHAPESPVPSRASARVGRAAPRYVLRLPDALRDFIQREANVNGRSVNSEIIHRLEESRHPVSLPGGRYAAHEPTARAEPQLIDAERAMLAVFRRFSPEKQLALLSLFK